MWGWYGIWLVGWTACVVLKQEPTQSGVGAVRYEVVAPRKLPEMSAWHTGYSMFRVCWDIGHAGSYMVG